MTTKEEIIDNIARLNSETWRDREEVRAEIEKLLAELRQELEQQSDDCVSRAEVLKQMKEWRDCEFVRMTNPYHYLEKRIQALSSVIPTQKRIPIRRNKNG